MQKVRFFSLLTALYIFSTAAMAQQPALGCNDRAIRLQAEQIKQDFKTQGQKIYKDAMITMESRQPSPIATQLQKGKLYQLIFVGSKDAKRISMELFDGRDKKIEDRTLKTPAQQNFIVYSFVPERTDVYLIVLTQNKGMQEMCGSFTIMEADDKKESTATPANNSKPKPATTPQPSKKGGK